jgi:hypothetical protein
VSEHRCTLPDWADVAVTGPVACTSPSCRRIWEPGAYGWRATDDVAPLPEHPAPVVPARDATDAERGGPRSGVRMLERAAVAAGWAVRVTYARGTYDGGRSQRVVDSVAVRFRRPGDFAGYAVWRDGRFGGAQLGLVPYGLRELTARLTAGDG